MLSKVLSEIGKATIRLFESAGRSFYMLRDAFMLLPAANSRHVLQQMGHLGADSLPIVLLTMLFTGMVMTVQIAHEFIKYGAQSSVGGVIAIAMGRELAPVLTGVVVAGRVGAAITAEIGSMKVTEQIDALRVMAVNPIAYLVAPRLLACLIMVPALVVLGDVIGTLGGYFMATSYAGIAESTFIHSIQVFSVPNDVTGGLIKAMFFGMIVALVGCHKGLTTENGAEGVGKATTGSVVTSIILIFISNYFLSLLLY
ncbi:MAG: ABC transporter permease [Sporomusaceae bacterium]|nr:ABC transporter permease [Sporomusaceae bacterium]